MEYRLGSDKKQKLQVGNYKKISSPFVGVQCVIINAYSLLNNINHKGTENNKHCPIS
ncbi:MAG: hypothetical protein ACI8Z9_000373 [Paraglaciecola sp.]|jgi:hypothetical protein